MLSRKTSIKFPFIANSDPAAAAQRLVASALFCCLLLVPLHVRAQLSLGEVVIGDTTAEESVEASVEEQVAEQVEEQAIEQVEDRVLSLGGPPDEVIESAIEESIEESVVDNIEEDVTRLRDKGYQFLADAPSPGAHGSKVIFIHPKSCDGVLIEINQPADEH